MESKMIKEIIGKNVENSEIKLEELKGISKKIRDMIFEENPVITAVELDIIMEYLNLELSYISKNLEPKRQIINQLKFNEWKKNSSFDIKS
ncbi:hypothetical protein DW261_03340 [Fusobacterium varium]|uniref:hypothetical protein n=1 Tax=Fusobacterium varium TaxID=856 RepID=UPI000E4E35FB|nr:hypothetical protein [Fusobacterium varium]RHG37440.1 hypothetical protein DW261_03340 [Fusobacterium varium]